jgi:hypothetical protein
MMKKNISRRDWQIISEYLDEQLSNRERARFETRLSEDPELRSALDEFRSIRSLLREIPAKRAPRNFTLTPQMIGIKAAPPHSFVALRFASALSAILLMAVYVSNLLIPIDIETLSPLIARSEKPDTSFEVAEPALHPPEDISGNGIGEDVTEESPVEMLRVPGEEPVEADDQDPMLEIMAFPEPDSTQTPEPEDDSERTDLAALPAPGEDESPESAYKPSDYEIDDKSEIGALAIRDNILTRVSQWGIQDYLMVGLAFIAVSTGLAAIYVRRRDGKWS